MHKQAKDQLPDEQDFISAVLDTAGALVVVLDRRGHIVRFNRACEQTTGYAFDEVKGKRFWDVLLIPEESPRVKAVFKDLVKGLGPNRGENYWLTRDGTKRLISWSNTTIPDASGSARYVVGTGIDITEQRRAEEALRASEEKYRELVENANSIILRMDTTGNITFFNEFAQRFFGYDQDEIIGRNVVGTIVPATDASGHDLRQMIKNIGLEPTRYANNENENVRRNGERVWVTWTNKAVKGDDGQTVEILCVGNDITDRRRGEEALRKARDELELRVRERTAEVSRTNQELMSEILDYVVVQACRLLGTDAGAVYRLQSDRELLTIQAAQGLPADYVASVTIPVGQGAVGQAVLEQRPVPIYDVWTTFPENHPLMKDPERRTHLMSMSRQYRALLGIPLMVKDEVYGGIVLYNAEPRQFSDQEIELAMVFGDQAALAIENARLRAQAEETAIAAERSRLARDLHDAVTQTLFSASLIAEVLPRLWERDVEEGRRRLEELRQLTRGALAEMRTLLLELRPAALMEAGLGELLRQLSEAITGRARVPVTLTVEPQQDLPADVHIGLYRIAQEALNNVAKHAGASKVAVTLRCRPGEVGLSVSDDGCGFDPIRVSSEHLGLDIMKERADAIGAELKITSQPGHGSQVLVTWQDTQRRKDK